MTATLPQTKIQVRISAPEVSTGEQLIAMTHQLVTQQYWQQYRQSYIGKMSWAEFCNGAPQSLKYLVPKDSWFLDPNKISNIKADMTDMPVTERQVVVHSDDKKEWRPDRGEEPVAVLVNLGRSYRNFRPKDGL